MNNRLISILPNDQGEICQTLFYQGNNSSQTQGLKYIGPQIFFTTTDQLAWCTGRNNLLPLNAIYKLYIGTEIADVNLQPFNSYFSFLNPIKVIGSALTYQSNWANGFHFTSSLTANPESVVFHSPVLSQMSIGQETDIRSHIKKYQTWLTKEDKTEGLILYGVSRGTAATFCAFAKEKYPEVRLVILEGAIDSVPAVLSKRYSERVVSLFNSTMSFFNKYNMVQYNENGPSPLKSVAEYPEGVPTVFITSKTDTEVPCSNTENIALALAKKQKNDVYLLKLERSSHPNYMFDDKEDRDNYEAFLHAIYKKYHLKHDPELAHKGHHLIAASLLYEVNDNISAMRQNNIL